MKLLAQLHEARWRVAAVLACAAALNYADRAAMSSVFAPLRAALALNDVQIGLLGSVFLWSYALGSPVAGIIADRWPRHRVIIVSLSLWSAVTVLTGAANSLMLLVAARCALGLAESLYLPAATALLAAHHGPETRGRAMSLHSVGLNFGVVLGGAFAGYLADHFGWRAGFWVLGGAGLVLAGLAPRWLAPAPEKCHPLGDSSARGPATGRRAEVWAAWRYLLRVPSYHVLLAKAMLAGVGIWIFLNWLPLYFREAFDMTLGKAGFAGTFMLQISTVLGIAAGGWISDRAAARGTRHRMLVQGLSYLAAAPFLLLFLTRPGFVAVAVAVSVFSFFRGVGQANENPTLCEIMPARFRSTAIGVMNTCATAAGGCGVLLAGVLKKSFGLNAVFAGISVLFVIAGLALIFAYRRWVAGDIERARHADAAH
ncbi:MAG: MFS transporter [Verrucomicrobia bacterium]|nr:MFS transporter [Verrucomicrobiota bacterium]